MSEEFPIDFYEVSDIEPEILVFNIDDLKGSEPEVRRANSLYSRPSKEFQSFSRHEPGKELVDKLIDVFFW